MPRSATRRLVPLLVLLVAVVCAAAAVRGSGTPERRSNMSATAPQLEPAAHPETARNKTLTAGSPTRAQPHPAGDTPPLGATITVAGAARPPRAAAARLPAQTGPARAVTRGVTTRRAVALTFDAGADRGYAEKILDILLDADVRASFGMTGVWAAEHPELVQRMAAEGHQLINHSYDHSSFTGLSSRRRPLSTEQRWAQLDRTEEIVQELTGTSTIPFFRSPYGDTDGSVLRDIGARGYAYNVLWTVDSRGWLGYSAGAIIQRCLSLAEPGAIYVFHVGMASQDGPALPAIITGLWDAGYTFETVAEIIAER